jgi:hypothetical protein
LEKQFEGTVKNISLNHEYVFGRGFSVKKCLETAVKKVGVSDDRMFVF